MPSDADLEVVRRFYAAVAAGDLDAAAACFADDGVWHLPGTSLIAGSHRGWREILDNVLRRVGPLSDGTFRAELVDVALGSEYVVAVQHATARRGVAAARHHRLPADPRRRREDRGDARPLLGSVRARRLLDRAVNVELRPMSEAEAHALAGWHYEPPYSFYDWTADENDLAELLGKESREGKYYSALDEDEALVGFFSFHEEDDDVVVGLGLRPDLTGRGLGLAYLEAGLAFARERFRPRRFRLSVATFNRRAIRVYERAGFERLREFDHETNGGVYRFLELARPVS